MNRFQAPTRLDGAVSPPLRHPVVAALLVAVLVTVIGPKALDAQTEPGGRRCDIQPCEQYVSGRTALWVLTGVAAAGVAWWLIQRSRSDSEDGPSPSIAAGTGSVRWRPLPDWLQASVKTHLLVEPAAVPPQERER